MNLRRSCQGQSPGERWQLSCLGFKVTRLKPGGPWWNSHVQWPEPLGGVPGQGASMNTWTGVSQRRSAPRSGRRTKRATPSSWCAHVWVIGFTSESLNPYLRPSAKCRTSDAGANGQPGRCCWSAVHGQRLLAAHHAVDQAGTARSYLHFAAQGLVPRWSHAQGFGECRTPLKQGFALNTPRIKAWLCGEGCPRDRV